MDEKNILRISQVERPWGGFRQFTRNSLSTVKIITVNPNEQLSLQSHTKREEFWRVVGGGGTIEINGMKYIASKDQEYSVPLGAKHRMSASLDGMVVLEIAVGEFDEEDITRYEDKYGRV